MSDTDAAGLPPATKPLGRQRISGTERAISWTIVALIAGVAVAVYLKGQHYDPELFGLDPARLPGARGAEPRPAADLGRVAPPGWRVLGAIERFTPQNLYEKIDGRADQYLAYDVVELRCASLAPGTDPARFVEVYAYDLGAPEHAFGIYSVERPPERQAVDLGREGYRSGASLFFWKGPFYVQVIPSDATEDLVAGAAAIADAVAAGVADVGEPLWGLDAFPAAGLVSGSVQYFLRDALSLDFLGNVYTAQYRSGDAVLTGFLSRQASHEAASAALAGYLRYIGDYGKLVAREQEGGAVLAVGDLGGTFEVVWQQGALLGGVTGAAERPAAERLARQLRQAVSG